MKTMKEYLSTADDVKQMWEKVNEVLDNFDFSKVVATMETLDWGWACTADEADEYAAVGCRTKDDGGDYFYYFPQYPQLLKQARKMIVECIEDMPDDENECSLSTGGFYIKVYICTDEERRDYYGSIGDVDDFAHSVDISLKFVVEESNSY